MPVSIRVGLYDNAVRVGEVVFRTLVILNDDAFTSTPANVLSPDEVEVIREALCRLPQINSGIVGRYLWREER